MNKVFKSFILAIAAFAALPCVKAQDKLVEAVALQQQMEHVDTMDLHVMLLNEAYIIPSDDMYPVWQHSGVHYNAALPDSYRIDLRGYVMPTTNTKNTDIFGYRPRRRRMHKGLDV